MRKMACLLALVGALAVCSSIRAEEPAAFTIDGVGYPRSLLDRRVDARMAAIGRNLQSLRHPTALKRLQQEVLERAIEEQLLAAEARRRGFAVSDSAIDAAIASGAAAPWAPAEAVRSQVRDDLLINALIRDIGAGVAREALAPRIQQEIDSLRAKAAIDVRVGVGR